MAEPSASNAAERDEVPMAQRADARRNRARVLEVARKLLVDNGTAISYDEIARRAGVGVGTVYRHIPTRDDLIRMVVDDGMRRLAAEARVLTTVEPAGAAFLRFFGLMAEQAAINKALCEAFETGAGPRAEPDPRAKREFEDAVGRLLARAQRAGDIRDDLDADDVRVLVVGAVMMDRMRGTTPVPGRMVALVAEWLCPGHTAAPPPVTKPGAEYNETPGPVADRDETSDAGAVRRCEVCGTALRAAGTGRPARFCSATCRQKAHRQRHNSGPGTRG